MLERRLGSCDVLAYPFGDWDARVAHAAAAAGYAFAFALPPVRRGGVTAMTIPRCRSTTRTTRCASSG